MNTTTTESQITSGKAESTIDNDPQFQKLHGEWISSREYFQDDSHPTVQADWKAFVTYIESVRENDKEKANARGWIECGEADDHLLISMRDRTEKAEAELKAIAERQAADLRKLSRYSCEPWDSYRISTDETDDGPWVRFDDVADLLSPTQQEPRSKE